MFNRRIQHSKCPICGGKSLHGHGLCKRHLESHTTLAKGLLKGMKTLTKKEQVIELLSLTCLSYSRIAQLVGRSTSQVKRIADELVTNES